MTDFNAIADTAVADVQSVIDALNTQRAQAGADTASIDAQVATLENKQDALRDLALHEIEDDPANAAAIAALNAASTDLTTQAKEVATAANALNSANQIVAAATSLLTAAAPFL
jgi:hypothetical protein